MKKTYITPELEMFRFNATPLMTASAPTGGNDNGEGETAESKCWGGSIFDDEPFSE